MSWTNARANIITAAKQYTSHTHTPEYDIIIYCYHIMCTVFLFYFYHYLLVEVWLNDRQISMKTTHIVHIILILDWEIFFIVIRRPIWYYITTLCITLSCFGIFFYPIQIILFLDNSRIKLDWKRFRNYDIYVIQNLFLFIFIFICNYWVGKYNFSAYDILFLTD